MSKPNGFKHLPLGSGHKIGMMIPEALVGEGLNNITPMRDQQVRYTREAFLSLREKVCKIPMSKMMAALIDYLLDLDPPRVSPRIAQLEVTADKARLLVCSHPSNPSFITHQVCAEYELLMALKSMAGDYMFTDEEIETLAYVMAKKIPESPKLVVPFHANE